MPHFIAKFATLLTLAALPTALSAEVRPGMTVKDRAGTTVGTIVAVSGDTYTVRTGKHDIPLPKSSFFESSGALLFGMKQAELDAAFKKAQAAVTAAIVVGATVRGKEGVVIGKIASIENDLVVVEVEGGDKVSLPRSGFSGDSQGAIVGITAEELRSHIAASKQP